MTRPGPADQCRLQQDSCNPQSPEFVRPALGLQAGHLLPCATGPRKAVVAVNKDQPVSNIRSMEQILGDSIYSRRLNMQLLAVFAAAALFLAAIGIYGMVSYSVSRRTHEIGVRMTLGAQAGQVLAMVIARAMALVAAGMVLGLAAAMALREVIRSQVYGISTTDPLIFVAGPSILILVALLAAYLPARRAAQVDPLVALRQE